MKQSRLDQLADSIFAIVMTILVFEIRIPDYAGIVDEQTLIQALITLAPIFLSYLLSFSLLFTYYARGREATHTISPGILPLSQVCCA